MRRTAVFAALAALAGCSAVKFGDLNLNTTSVGPVTNHVSNVATSRAWRQTYIKGLEGGTVTDPSGTIASYAQGAAQIAMAQHTQTIAQGAQEGLSNVITRLNQSLVSADLSIFSNRVYVAADFNPSDTTRSNLWMYVAKRVMRDADLEDDFYVWFSHELDNAPVFRARYRVEAGDTWVTGEWEAPFTNKVYTVDGWQNCHKVTFERPANLETVVLKVNPYVKLGSDEPNGVFDFRNKGFEILTAGGSVTNAPFSGVWTNSNSVVEQYVNGLFIQDLAN